jgi:hypothetical protein
MYVTFCLTILVPPVPLVVTSVFPLYSFLRLGQLLVLLTVPVSQSS